MNKAKIKKKQTFWTWLHQNRIRAFLWAFLIIIPVSLVLIAYVGSYTHNKKVHFDQTETPETEYIKDFMSVDEISSLNLFIEWDQLRNPDYDSTNEQFYNGYYRFNVWYQPKLNYQINSVKIIPVLQTDWINLRSIGLERLIYPMNQGIHVDFNYELPRTPLLFVSVKEPNLYLKIIINMTFAGTTSEQTVYVKYDLSNVNPNLVVQ
jgi:hypothetical protein